MAIRFYAEKIDGAIYLLPSVSLGLFRSVRVESESRSVWTLFLDLSVWTRSFDLRVDLPTFAAHLRSRRSSV